MSSPTHATPSETNQQRVPEMHGRHSLARLTTPFRSISDPAGALQRGGAAADLSARKACACEWRTSASTERSRAAHSSTAWRVGACPSSRTASSCACSETRPRCAEPTVSAMPSTARRAASASRIIAASCAEWHARNQRLSGGEEGSSRSMLQSHAWGNGSRLLPAARRARSAPRAHHV